MKKVNFKVINDVTIKTANGELDLHNCFDFDGFHYKTDSRELTLLWRRNEFGIHATTAVQKVLIVFNKVVFFAVKPRDNDYPFTEDKTVETIGYLSPELIDVIDQFTPERLSDDSYHMIFIFASQYAIKVYAEEVLVMEVNDPN